MHFEESQLHQFQEQEISIPQTLNEWYIFVYFLEPVDVVPQEQAISVEIVIVPVVWLEKGVPVVPKQNWISAEEKEVSVEKKAIFVQGKGICAERNALESDKFKQKSPQWIPDTLTSYLLAENNFVVADLL